MAEQIVDFFGLEVKVEPDAQGSQRLMTAFVAAATSNPILSLTNTDKDMGLERHINAEIAAKAVPKISSEVGAAIAILNNLTDKPLNSKQLATVSGFGASFIRKIAVTLKQVGLLEVTKGKTGGFIRNPSVDYAALSMMDIYLALQQFTVYDQFDPRYRLAMALQASLKTAKILA